MFLTIKEYDKLNWVDINTTHYIREIREAKNFYDFYCVNKITNFSAVIGLRRGGIWDDTLKEWQYNILWNGRETHQWVTSDWIADKDNMIGALKGVIEEHPF